MESEDIQINDVVYMVADDYDEANKINVSILQKGRVIAIHEDIELVVVEWLSPTVDDDDWVASCFVFKQKSEAIAEYVSRHAEDLIRQSEKL